MVGLVVGTLLGPEGVDSQHPADALMVSGRGVVVRWGRSLLVVSLVGWEVVGGCLW